MSLNAVLGRILGVHDRGDRQDSLKIVVGVPNIGTNWYKMQPNIRTSKIIYPSILLIFGKISWSSKTEFLGILNFKKKLFVL